MALRVDAVFPAVADAQPAVSTAMLAQAAATRLDMDTDDRRSGHLTAFLLRVRNARPFMVGGTLIEISCRISADPRAVDGGSSVQAKVSRNWNRQPTAVLWTDTDPSCASTMPRVIARPNPAPPESAPGVRAGLPR